MHQPPWKWPSQTLPVLHARPPLQRSLVQESTVYMGRTPRRRSVCPRAPTDWRLQSPNCGSPPLPICCVKAVNRDAKELKNTESKGHKCPKGGRIVFTIDGHPHTAFSSSVQSMPNLYLRNFLKASMKGKVYHEAQTMKHMYVYRRCNHQWTPKRLCLISATPGFNNSFFSWPSLLIVTLLGLGRTCLENNRVTGLAVALLLHTSCFWGSALGGLGIDIHLCGKWMVSVCKSIIDD